MSVSLTQARAAKRQLAEQLKYAHEVNGIGIVRSNGDYGLKVNLVEPVRANSLPDEVDGVSISFDVVGPSFPA